MAFPAAAHTARRPSSESPGKSRQGRTCDHRHPLQASPLPLACKGPYRPTPQTRKNIRPIPKTARPSVIDADTCRSGADYPFLPHPNAQALVKVVGILPPFEPTTGPKDSPCDTCSVRALTDSRGACFCAWWTSRNVQTASPPASSPAAQYGRSAPKKEKGWRVTAPSERPPGYCCLQMAAFSGGWAHGDTLHGKLSRLGRFSTKLALWFSSFTYW